MKTRSTLVALALASLSVLALAACSSTTCESRAVVGDPNLTSATCTAGKVQIVGDGCTLGSPTQCTYTVKGTAIVFTVTSDFCKSSGTTSAGCGNADATCTGPTLAKGSYGIASQTGATLVVDDVGGCTFQR